MNSHPRHYWLAAAMRLMQIGDSLVRYRMSAAIEDSGTVQKLTFLAMALEPRLFFLTTEGPFTSPTRLGVSLLGGKNLLSDRHDDNASTAHYFGHRESPNCTIGENRSFLHHPTPQGAVITLCVPQRAA